MHILNKTRNLNKKHYNTLIGERKSGSRWGKELGAADLEYLIDHGVELANDGTDKRMIPICTYLKVDISEILPDATVNMLLVSELDDDVTIHIVEGSHGPEYVIHTSTVRPTNIAHIIIGPAEDENGKAIEGERMIWTTYPGPLTEKADEEIGKQWPVGSTVTVRELIAAGGGNWAIKLI